LSALLTVVVPSRFCRSNLTLWEQGTPERGRRWQGAAKLTVAIDSNWPIAVRRCHKLNDRNRCSAVARNAQLHAC
jgi:hypothetical protein